MPLLRSSAAGRRVAVQPVGVARQTSYKTVKLARQTANSRGSIAAPSNPEATPQHEQQVQAKWAWMQWWDALPSRHKVVAATAMSFILSNMDKVNLSVAIIPMAQDFGWSPTVAGVVQSSFFWGYMASQLPSGYANSRFGGRNILPAGVLLWSLGTAVVPWSAATIPSLCLSRASVGFGEASAPSAATDMVARAALPTERARSVTFIFSGLHVGSIIGLLATPWLISHCGWRSVFLSFGAMGVVWWLWFEKVLMPRITAEEPEFAARLSGQFQEAATTSGRLSAASPPQQQEQQLPWRAFLRSDCVKALAYTHFANNWFHYVFLAWLPTYFVDTLSVDLMHASQTALLPPLAGIAASAAAGAGTDILVAKGVPVPTVRKLAQNIAFLIPTAFLVAVCLPEVSENSTLSVAAITLALGISSFSLAGLFCTHQDLSRKYAPILLGLTNTTAAIPGVLGVASVGYLYDKTQSWEWALFLPSAFFLVTAAAAYTLWVKNEPIDFDNADNSPFTWEGKLNAFKDAVTSVWCKVRPDGDHTHSS